MKQIRKGVFETNSSSVHAICINNHYDIPNVDGICFGYGEFGWQYGTLNYLSGKANYLWTGINEFYENEPDKIEEICNKIKEWFREDCIVALFEEKNEDSFWRTGYVDHCNELIDFLEWVLECKENLYSYLFGDSLVELGNDNDEDAIPSIGNYNEKYDRIFVKGN